MPTTPITIRFPGDILARARAAYHVAAAAGGPDSLNAWVVQAVRDKLETHDCNLPEQRTAQGKGRAALAKAKEG